MSDCSKSEQISNEQVSLNRRSLMGSALGLIGAAAALPGVATAQTPSANSAKRVPIDFNSAKDNLRAYIKMIGDLSGKPTVSQLSGHIFGVVGNELLRPLCGFKGFGTGFTRYRPDGTVEVGWREVAFYTDLVTGEVLEKWQNPYTKEVVDVMPVHNDPVNFLLSEKLTSSIIPENATNPTGRQFRAGNYGHDGQFIMPWMVDRSTDFASIMYDVHGVRPNPFDEKDWPKEYSGKPTVRVTETFQYGAKLSELENPDLTTVRYVGGWQRICDWLPWMLMRDQPGHMFYRSVVRNLDSIENVDPVILKYAKANYPKFLTPPEQWSTANVGSYDVYKTWKKPGSAK